MEDHFLNVDLMVVVNHMKMTYVEMYAILWVN